MYRNSRERRRTEEKQEKEKNEAEAKAKAKAKAKANRIPGIFREMKYNDISDNDSVVILCAGPSLNIYATNVIDYIKNNKSLVIAANYNFEDRGIKSDYTYITDQEKLIENLEKIKSHLVMPIKMKTDSDKNKIEKFLRSYGGKMKNYIAKKFDCDKYKVFHVGVRDGNTVYSETGKLKIGKSGVFPYRRLGSAGQGAIMIALLARPKKMLIVGLDGPKQEEGTCSKMLYDGRFIKYDKDKFVRITDYIRDILLPSVISMGVTIETFKDVAFYGIDKEKAGVKIIE